ncbi:MAG: MotA/TolQ/ExbB proton channel family protein [Kiritimatiellae bacterium]|nr:MotA/TolQ/ExbB proton channel family protein [Kiritimatiellia bacterium]
MNETGITLAQAWNYGGPLMWVLAGLSVIAGAIVLYLLFAQRRGALAPRTLVSDVFSKLQAGDHGEARRLCDRRPCAFSSLVLAALDSVRTTPAGQRPSVSQAVETAGAHAAERLQASVDWLADIAAIAPLVGLLGTVLGMFQAFGGIAGDLAANARPVVLAQGVSQAIVTTVFGLVISIPCLAFHAMLRRRTAKRIAGLETLAVILEKAF